MYFDKYMSVPLFKIRTSVPPPWILRYLSMLHIPSIRPITGWMVNGDVLIFTGIYFWKSYLSPSSILTVLLLVLTLVLS